jgi:poly(ribitol-phosphate) beta-N-acetylglucosaminyltransferase
MRAKVTICIPTYNRARMLRYLLDELDTQAGLVDPSDFQIVVSDNCSTDDTQEVIAGYAGRISLVGYRRERNLGAYNNLLFAYRKASTEFAVYCADDDVINLVKVRELVAEMETSPELGAIYCAWNVQKDLAAAKQPFFTMETTLFKKNDHAHTLLSILDKRVFPETAIYRTAATRCFASRSNIAFWFFAGLHAILMDWDIAIKDKSHSYYTSFLEHPVDPRPRLGLGNQENATAWDTFRGGLEVFAQTARRQNGLGPQELAPILTKINQFVTERQFTAACIHLKLGNYIDAYWLSKRVALFHPMAEREIEALRIAAAIEDCYNQNFGDRPERAAILVGPMPNLFTELVKTFGTGWFANEGLARLGTPRIAWNGDPAIKSDAVAEPHLAAFPL